MPHNHSIAHIAPVATRLRLLCASIMAALLAVSALLFINRISASGATQQLAQTPTATVALTRIHPALLKALESANQDESLPIIVEWRRTLDKAIFAAPQAGATARLETRTRLLATLQDETQRQAAPLMRRLQLAAQHGQASDVRSFWIDPIIALHATPALIQTIAGWGEVSQVRLDERIMLEKTDYVPAGDSASTTSLPFDLLMMQVNLAQQTLGLDGHGVVVANLDTGVDWQHPALLTHYRGYNPHGPANHIGNWYVVTGEPYLYPGDGVGHGTHTMGTMIGDDGSGNRIGVAPGAQWIAVKVFDNTGATYESWIHAAFQWIMAPNLDPSLAPDIVNCSWGSTDGSDARFRPDVSALRAAGILPVFSAGNDGPAPYTVGSPGSFPESLAVGAVDANKNVANFSSRGPSPWGEVKPELAAPGVGIRSSFPGGGYAYANGTSMAAPHVAGLAALLLQSKPSLTPNELETLLENTTQPLGSPIPNQNTGWGLADAYAAGLAVSPHGEVNGVVQNTHGVTLPYPTITATDHAESISVTVSGDDQGRFLLALKPGRYDLTVSAFSYQSQTRYSLEVITDTQTVANFSLSSLPLGMITGHVRDAQSGAPLSATLTISGTPILKQTNSADGSYSLSLPAGDWPIRIQADAHRVGHITPTITISQSVVSDVTLAPAPRILLVDGGAWYYGSQLRYYEEALDSANYPYSQWPINLVGSDYDLSYSVPTTKSLGAYDLVIWSSPQDSPGMVSAGNVLSYYLSTGGHLIVSGQDIAYYDSGSSFGVLPQAYLLRDLGIHWRSEGNLGNLNGVPGSPLDGLLVPLNTADSARQQIDPDAVNILKSTHTHPSLQWSDDTTGGVVAGTCRPFRAAWLGFGLEGTGPRSVRQALLQRIIDWMAQPPDPYGLVVSHTLATQVALPGDTITHPITVESTGVSPDIYHIQVLSSDWPIDLTLPDGQHTNSTANFSLAACASSPIMASVSVPTNLPRNTHASAIIRLSSLNSPLVSSTITLTAKTPASLLLVDAERWYHYPQTYTQALDDLHIPYDQWDVAGSHPPPASILARYPMTLWWTGYDWFNPLGNSAETSLATYLDNGGNLLLSSQDVLDVRRVDSFVKQRLGVTYADYSVSPTLAIAMPGNPLHLEPQPWNLTYPFTNWSDGIGRIHGSLPALEDDNTNELGSLVKGQGWRTAFYSFPLETLDRNAIGALLDHTLLWLSPFGESRLAAPPAASAGSQVPITLTIGVSDSASRNGLSASLPLLPETSLVPGSVHGPWGYNAGDNSLEWQGTLSPGSPLTLTARLTLSPTLSSGARLHLQAQLSDANGFVIPASAAIMIGTPWLTIDTQANPSVTIPGATVHMTITVNNLGVVSSPAVLTETIPSGLQILTGTLHNTAGSITDTASGFRWNDAHAPGDLCLITYQARVAVPTPGARLVVGSELSTPTQERLVYQIIKVPVYRYFPWLLNTTP